MGICALLQAPHERQHCEQWAPQPDRTALLPCDVVGTAAETSRCLSSSFDIASPARSPPSRLKVHGDGLDLTRRPTCSMYSVIRSLARIDSPFITPVHVVSAKIDVLG
jgi:hypothetical protein